MSGPAPPDEYDLGSSRFVPDDFDDAGFDEDMVAAAEAGGDFNEELAMAEMEAAEDEQQAKAGQSGKRRLDFDSYPALSAAAGDTQRLSQASFSQAELSLALVDDPLEAPAARPAAAKPAAPAVLSHFERERAAEAAGHAKAHAAHHPQSTPSSAGAMSVLPAMHRSISDLRAKVDEERTFVFRRAPVASPSISVTTAKGDRMFVAMDSEETVAARVASHRALSRSQQMHRSLGQTNMRALMREIDAESTEVARLASVVKAEAMLLESDPEDDEKSRLTKRRQRKERLIKRLDAAEADQRASARNRRLWVDKYAPKGYADLLSPEHINREVLEWLRGWDLCVFGEKHTKAAADEAKARELDNNLLTNSVLSPSRKAAKKNRTTAASATGEGPIDIRPEHKVILLCGPPGLGKTTLAHILARQAGYHPFEINASDDRTPALLEAKIRAATEMQSVSFGTEHTARPNCVIIDEIDGVGGEGSGGELGAIATLLKIVNAEAKSKTKKGKADEAKQADDGDDDESDEDEESPVVVKRKTKASSSDAPAKAAPLGPLKRPIICICNDQFVAALRPLRAVARIFEFTAAPKAKFVDRLKFIAGREGMDYDPRTLGALADATDCDIRSALNTLQFVHSKGHKLTAASINATAVGRKDVEKSRFQVWDSVFCNKETKKDNVLKFRNMRETESHNDKLVSSNDLKAKELQGLLADAGDMDKILEGIFFNYPKVGYADPNLSKTVECAEWLAYADLLERRIQTEVELSLNQYTPYAAIAIHHLTARPRKVAIENPSMFYHQWVESQRNTQILRSFLSPANRLTLDGATLSSTVLDVLPYVLDILHPTIRAVNYQMLTASEKGDIGNLIDTMLNLSVTFRPEVQSAFGNVSHTATWNKPSDIGNVVYKLEPAIDLLAEWSNPLDSATAKSFEPKDKFGNIIQSKFAKFQRPQAAPVAAAANFHIDRRDVHMPAKVKQMVLRELEFEAMRRYEARLQEKFEAAAPTAASAGAKGSAVPPSTPSLISPAVQRLLDEEKRKRERSAMPSTPAGGSAPKEEDESPATKRAKTSAALNFLTKHADAAKNKRNRGGRAAPAATKLDLAHLPTEKASAAGASMDTSDGSSAIVVPSGASAVLSRFSHPLHYKFNEGCTNAVRRTVNVAHFMPL